MFFFHSLTNNKTKHLKPKAEYLLDDMKSYQYLSNLYVPIQGVDEVEEYNNTIKSMHIMGMNNEDIISIVRTVSGVLQMGNLSFKQERQSDQATLPDNTVAQKVCYLFGLNVTDFTRSLLKPKLKVGRDFVTKAQNKEQVFWFCFEKFAIEKKTQRQSSVNLISNFLKCR